jgi:hypothetical protein
MSEQAEKDTESRRQQLKAATDRKQKMNEAEPWEPAEGEVLEGEYLGKRTTSGFGSETPVYYVEDWDGNVHSILGHTMMVAEMQQEDAEPGDLISVTYEGMQNADGAKGEFYAYTVVTA